LDSILSVTLLEEDELIITYMNASDISVLPAREELLQLSAPGVGSKNEIEGLTLFSLSIEEDCFDNDIGNS
jgi:hypothetical protein